MKYRKITKEDTKNLKVGDVVLIYPSDGGTAEFFDENDTDKISPTIVDSIVFDNIELSFGFPKEGIPWENYTVKIGTLHKKLEELIEHGRYWMKVDDTDTEKK